MKESKFVLQIRKAMQERAKEMGKFIYVKKIVMTGGLMEPGTPDLLGMAPIGFGIEAKVEELPKHDRSIVWNHPCSDDQDRNLKDIERAGGHSLVLIAISPRTAVMFPLEHWEGHKRCTLETLKVYMEALPQYVINKKGDKWNVDNLLNFLFKNLSPEE